MDMMWSHFVDHKLVGHLCGHISDCSFFRNENQSKNAGGRVKFGKINIRQNKHFREKLR